MTLRDNFVAIKTLKRLQSEVLPESTNEDSIAELCDIIKNDLLIQPILENTHRIGVRIDDGSSRLIWPKSCPLKLLKRRESFAKCSLFGWLDIGISPKEEATEIYYE